MNHRRALEHLLPGALLLGALAGCANIPEGQAPAPAPRRMDTGGTRCTDTIGDASASHVCVERVVGRVTDQDGRPVTGVLLTLCGMGQCRDLAPNSNGEFDYRIDARLNPAVFAVHAEAPQQPYALLYAQMPQVRAGVATFESPIRLHRMNSEGAAIVRGMSAGQTVTAGDVTLTIPRGAMILPSLADEERTLEFRSVGVAMYQSPAFAQGASMSALYALAPTALTSTMSMRVRVRNRAELAAGQRVEFVTMGTDIEADRFDAGSLIVLGLGRVTADGQFIESDEGVGVRELHWVGVRVKRAL